MAASNHVDPPQLAAGPSAAVHADVSNRAVSPPNKRLSAYQGSGFINVHQDILADAHRILPAQAPDLRRRGVPASAAVRCALQQVLQEEGTASCGVEVSPEVVTAQQRRVALLRALAPTAQVAPGEPIDGAVLRRLRDSCGASLKDIADLSKISQRYLAAIEADDFLNLPAYVYVRGFVFEYARILGLDAPVITTGYMVGFKRFHGG
jgi:hypothetical protein